MYTAAPVTRTFQTTGAAAAGASPWWMDGLTAMHLVVAVTSLIALSLAMAKLLPAVRRPWAVAPVPHDTVVSHGAGRRRG